MPKLHIFNDFNPLTPYDLNTCGQSKNEKGKPLSGALTSKLKI